MFGYVKTDTPSLRVREHELYRALYCGLCRSIGKEAGQVQRLALSYDFTFLAAVRLLAEGEAPSLSRGRCVAHPIKERAYIEPCRALTYASACSAVLARGKTLDNIADESALASLTARVALPAMKHSVKLCERREQETVLQLSAHCEKYLSQLSCLEKAMCESLDEVAETFGELLGELFATGLDGGVSRVCREIGFAVGKTVYICDAADDAAEDLRRGRYNPILKCFGEDIFFTHEKRKYLKRELADDLYSAAMLHLSRAEGAVELLCDNAVRDVAVSDGTGDDERRIVSDIAEIVRNTVYSGLPASLCRVLYPRENNMMNKKSI